MKPVRKKSTRELLRTRRRVDADSPEGHRCSNIAEMRQHLPPANVKDPARRAQRERLLRDIAAQESQLASLVSSHHQGGEK